MSNTKFLQTLILILFIPASLLSSTALEQSNASLTLIDIITKNIAAAGGKTKIEETKFISFTVPSTRLKDAADTYYASSTGDMKVVSKVKTLVPRTVIVKKGHIECNDFSSAMKLTDLEKVKLVCFAKIFSSAFTLKKFAKQLTLTGLKKYGPEKFYLLHTAIKDHTIKFYIGAGDFLLKRVLFEGFDEKQGNYKSTSAFANFVDSNGVKIPTTWFESYLGAAYSNINKEQKITDIKINPEQEKGFFQRPAVNFGKVSISAGGLEGNVIYSNAYPPRTVIMTVNWTSKMVEQAGFKSREAVLVKIAGEEFPATYVSSVYKLSDGDLDKEIVYLMKAEGYPYWWIYFRGAKYQPVAKKFKLLLPASVHRVNK